MRDKIIDILMCELQGEDRDTIYCGTCIANELNIGDREDRCDDCHRKNMEWGISRERAGEIADMIMLEMSPKTSCR